MPLFDISAAEAVETRKANPFATWPERSRANRVEPVAKPFFKAPFPLRRGEAIFTVGSCFARNVEVELMKCGFEVPMRQLLKQPEFRNMESGIVNNFGTPSIYNEFAWALGERPFVPEEHFVEVLPGKFADMHIVPSIRAENWDWVLARRRAITEAYRTVRDCRVVIMTLGLIEVWFDTKSSYYLNAPPRPSVVKREPERFRLHILSYEEVYHYLEGALRLIKAHGHTDVAVLLTISPVPLTATHREQDVMVANTYSKSVLRAAAEAAAARNDFVTYFPSYESVTLSARNIAWRDDMVHVTDAIVALNVSRLFEAFVDDDAIASRYQREIAEGGILMAVEWARKIRESNANEAEVFFGRYATLAEESVEFAFEYADYLTSKEDYTGALAVLDRAPDAGEDLQVVIAGVKLLLKLGDARRAYERLDPFATPEQRLHSVWDHLAGAAKAADDGELLKAVTERWCGAVPKKAGRTRSLTGRWFHMRKDFATARGYLQQAVQLSPEDATARIFYVQTLDALGRVEEAEANFALVRPTTPNEIILFERLQRRFGVAGKDVTGEHANGNAVPEHHSYEISVR